MRESDYRRTNQIDSGPEGSTGMLDPVNQTGKHIQTETGVEQLSVCQIPGCRCDGRVVNMKWGPDGLPDMDDSEYESNTSDRVFQTDQESPKLGPTVQPIMVADDVIPIPRDQPVMDSETKWDKEVPLEPSDPGYWPYVNRLVSQALRRDEDTLVDDEYPEIVEYIVKNVWMSGRAWYEHGIRLDKQQTGLYNTRLSV